jgi:magnesium-transporting ATPase (P-type)
MQKDNDDKEYGKILIELIKLVDNNFKGKIWNVRYFLSLITNMAFLLSIIFIAVFVLSSIASFLGQLELIEQISAVFSEITIFIAIFALISKTEAS